MEIEINARVLEYQIGVDTPVTGDHSAVSIEGVDAEGEPITFIVKNTSDAVAAALGRMSTESLSRDTILNTMINAVDVRGRVRAALLSNIKRFDDILVDSEFDDELLDEFFDEHIKEKYVLHPESKINMEADRARYATEIKQWKMESNSTDYVKNIAGRVISITIMDHLLQDGNTITVDEAIKMVEKIPDVQLAVILENFNVVECVTYFINTVLIGQKYYIEYA